MIEKYGSGIRRVIAYFKESKLPQPVFRNISDGFLVTVFAGGKLNAINDDTGRDTDRDTGCDTDHRKDLILKEITKNNTISIHKLAQLCHVSKSTILRDLKKLKKSGLLKRTGTEKSGYWEILNTDFTN